MTALTTSQELTTEARTTSPFTTSTPEYYTESLGTSFIIKTLPPNFVLPSAASASNGITLLPPQVVIKNAIENRPTDYQQPEENNFPQQPSGFPDQQQPQTINPANFVTTFVTASEFENLPTVPPTINSQSSSVLNERQPLVPLTEDVENFGGKQTVLRPEPIVPLPKSESVDEEDDGRVGGLRPLETAATSMIPPTFMPEGFEIPTRKPQKILPTSNPSLSTDDITFETAPGEEEIDIAENTGTEFIVNQGTDLSIEAANIKLSKENNQLKLEWEQPLIAICDSFNVNYTVISLKHPKTFTIKTTTNFASMKMLIGHQLDMKVNCMFEGGISKQWWAHRLVDLGKPVPVQNLKISSIETNEFFVASITVTFDWPAHHDFEYYDIVVAWSPGKKILGNDILRVNEKGPITISKLEAAKLYTLTVRNVSRELEIASPAKGLRQITPPIITSTVYPGQISNNAININFGESDPEHSFDSYELTFSGSAKNITKKLKKDD
uniref:Fibronectin type-III domain-containing protein n=1 Tax=Panagrolaimus sp. ES5 TaxID=591445 RepID=A0AC34G2N6_9BILA